MRRVLRRSAAAPLHLLVLAASCLAMAPVWAQQKPIPGAIFSGGRGGESASINQRPASGAALSDVMPGTGRSTAGWLTRLRQATRTPAYTGTYVVWSTSGTLVSSHIWHASKGDMQVERVDALSGQRRSTYRATDRRGSDVTTFLFAQGVLRIDHSDAAGGGGFPNLPDAGRGVSSADYYDAQQKGQERVSGFMADVVQLAPHDDLRYGYRVWSEQRTGFPIKLQTLDAQGRVLEQAAFSGLTFDAPINAAKLLHEMHRTRGWRVERVVRVPTTAMAEGWRIGSPAEQPVPGFALQRCYRQPTPADDARAPASSRPASPAPGDSAAGGRGKAGQLRWFQCVFSDGLAVVSVFIEPYDAARHEEHHGSELDVALGATHLLTRRVGDTGWVTVVGEVPQQTLKRFAAEVARLP